LKPDEKQQQPPNEDDAKTAAENQVRALRITMYVMGGIILGSGMYIFFVYGNSFYLYCEKIITCKLSPVFISF